MAQMTVSITQKQSLLGITGFKNIKSLRNLWHNRNSWFEVKGFKNMRD
jgi:hypothetical protein